MSNYPPLEHRPKGSRLPEGEWFNDIIDRVNAITEDPLPQAGPSPAINFTGTTVAGSTTVSGIADTTGLAAGQEITGVGIQALTTIASVGPSSLTLSQIASYSNTTPMQAYPGSPVPVSQVGQNDSVFRKITVTAEEVASQTLTINRTSGNVQIVYQNPYDSTKPQIRAINLGSGGGSVAQLKGYNFTNQQSPANLKTLFDPALVIFHYGYEIAGQRASPGVPAATMVAEFISNMSAEIEAWQALGVDVMLMSMHPWSDEYPDGLYRDQATVLQGREAIYQIADTFDLPLIDNYSRWGSHEEAFAAGLIEHFARPLPAGDWDLARAAAFALSSV